VFRGEVKAGMVVRLTCQNYDLECWTSEGVVQSANWDGYIILDGPDDIIDWYCVKKIELLSLLPPEDE
jgi:hypothetical protein